MPRATAHRLAVALEVHELLDRDGDGRFVLGPRVGELAAARPDPFIVAAAPVLAWVRDESGESAQLYRRDGIERVCIASAERTHGLAPRCRSAVGCRSRPARVPRFCVLGSSTNRSARRCCRRRGLPSAVWSRSDDAVGPNRSGSAKLASRRCPPPCETGPAMLLRRCPSPVRSSGSAVHPDPVIPRSSWTAHGGSARQWRPSSLRHMTAGSKVRSLPGVSHGV